MSNSVQLELQIAGNAEGLPPETEIRRWLRDTLRLASPQAADCEIVVRIVDEAESRDLNHRYRLRDCPTNVLAFPATAPGDLPGPVSARGNTLGDLVLCGPIVAREAAEQGKDIAAHWAHLLVHGTLHLLGYDHSNDNEASRMEGLEARILASRGIGDPYAPR